MGGGSRRRRYPFREQLERWKMVGGGIDRDGNIIGEPWQLQKARLIDGLCQRYGCLPSQLLEEDTDILLKMQTILSLSGDNEKQSDMESSLANMSQGM